ncbi:MAG: hypothetical protein J6Q54_04570, partial [Oscillospiraceae bacterium]|nr:hypothetical protein [Oscillospiraceae bacterium]
FKKLTEVQDSNPNTQYWLVVITDGAFEHMFEGSEITDYYYNAFVSDARLKEIESNMRQRLNEKFADMADEKMPNGSSLQTTFMAISTPFIIDEVPTKNIYTYEASDSQSIMETMSDMADRVSGRRRLTEKEIKKLDDTTIEISSTIPLLNIVAFAQGCKAKVTAASDAQGGNIPVSRQVSLSHSGDSALVGGSYMLGDSQTVIPAGNYKVTFDQAVDLNNVVVLFEPALELRTTIQVDGQTITDPQELENTTAGNKISISGKLYEMGTDKEVDPNLLPPGTKYELYVMEDGKMTKQVLDTNLELKEYELKNIDTVIYAGVTISGFDPIAFSKRFTPGEYVPPTTLPPIVYTIEAGYEGSTQSIRYEDLGSNTELVISFRVYADGEAITDPETVKSLNPVVTADPQGNGGDMTYSNDGKILFTPKYAGAIANGETATIHVTCTIDDGTTASQSYTVLMADYAVTGKDAEKSIVKTEFYGNEIGASFTIIKDGVQLNRDAVKDGIKVQFNEAHQQMIPFVDISDTGVITIAPQSAEDRELNFKTWWFNWAWYFGISSEDVEVTLMHPYGTAKASIPVVEADVGYLCLNVILPLVLELALLLVLTNYLYCVLTKPKFGKTAILFVGDIRYNVANGTHMVRNFRAVHLSQFNKIAKGNGRLEFKKKAKVISVNGIDLRAELHGDVCCEELFPWYKSRVVPVDDVKITKPEDLVKLTQNKSLEIEEFAVTETVNENYQRNLPSATSRVAKYYVAPDAGAVVTIEDKKVIRSGKIFIYKIS